MIRVVRCFVFVLLATSTLLFAADGSSLLKTLTTKYSAAKNITVKFTESNGNIHGTAIVQGSAKFHIELNDRLIVCNGSTVWNYTSADNRVTIDNYHPNRKNLSPEFFITQLPSDAHAQVVNGVKAGRKLLVLDPPSADAWGMIAKLTVETDDAATTIYGVTFVDASGVSHSIHVLSTKFDQKLSADAFEFSPPVGASVMDVR